MTTDARQSAKPMGPIKGPGLTVAGVILLQSLVILVAEAFEYQFTKVGMITGIALLIAFLGGIYLGRPGTAFAAVVNPPIAFFFSTIFLMGTIGGTGLHLTKIGIDLIANLGGVAPFLTFGALVGWVNYLIKQRKAAKSELQN